jgi:hypothetical protein
LGSNTVRTNPREEEVWPPPKPEEEATGGLRAGDLQEYTYIPFKEKMIDNWCRLLGTSSLKEGAV